MPKYSCSKAIKLSQNSIALWGYRGGLNRANDPRVCDARNRDVAEQVNPAMVSGLIKKVEMSERQLIQDPGCENQRSARMAQRTLAFQVLSNLTVAS